MIDPNLKRAVWLTEQQRSQLFDAATRAFATDGSNPETCQSIINEIQSLDERLITWHGRIIAIVKLLDLEPDSLPLYLSHMEIEEVVVYGDLNLDLADFIDPPIPQNIFYDPPRYD